MNPFALLGVPVRVLLNDDEIKNAWHQAVAQADPGDLEKINLAYEQLRDPSKRIAAFQKIHHQPVAAQASPGKALFTLFSTVESAFRQADQHLEPATTASTALQRAAHLPALLEAQTKLEGILNLIKKNADDRKLIMQEIDEAGHALSAENWQNLAILANDFVFLTKWENGTRQRLGKIQTLLFGELA